MKKFEWNINKNNKGKIILNGYKFDVKDFINEIDIEYYFGDKIENYCNNYASDDISYYDLREEAFYEVMEYLIEDPYEYGIFDIFLAEIGDVDLDFTGKGITDIGDNAFYKCKNINSIKLPETLEYMGESVFEYCDNLKEIELPSSLKEIKKNTFNYYKGKIKIDLSSYTPDIFDSEAIDLLFFSNIDSLKGGKIQEWIDYFKLNMDIYFKKILNEKDNKFLTFLLENKCFSLEDISSLLKLSSKKNKIDISSILLDYQHKNFTEEEQINFTVSNITELRKIFRTFNKNEEELFITKFLSNEIFDTIEIPESIGDRKVVEIFAEAFSPNQKRLEKKEINSRKKLKKVIISKNVSVIGEKAFKGCKGLTEIVIPSSITVIKESTFENCSKLKKIEIPSSVIKIEKNAFKGCTSLTKILLPSAITSIEESAFENCKNLKELTLPSSIKDIGNNVFKNCKNLIKVTLECNPKSIWNGGLFEGCSNIEYINLPKDVGDSVFFRGFINSIFRDFKKLKTLRIPEGITQITAHAFSKYINLESIYISSTVEDINEICFINCDNLKTIEISSDNKNFYVKDNEIYNKDGICIYCPENQREECDVDTSLFSDEIIKEEGTDYLLFGYWPQSLKEKNIILDKKHKYNVKGFVCYKGSNGDYYTNQYYSFAANSDLMKNSLSYFKIESIRWVIASNNFQEKKLLLTKDVIFVSPFSPANRKEFALADYKHSIVRALLNGLDGSEYQVKNFSGNGFIDKAFSSDARKKIVEILLNSNIKDKVFLLSKEEMEYIKSNENFEYNPKYTDYVRSRYKINNWWLRTKKESSYNEQVYCGNESVCVNNGFQGIVAAITIEKDGVITISNSEDKECSKIIIRGYDENGEVIENKEKLLEVLKKHLL